MYVSPPMLAISDVINSQYAVYITWSSAFAHQINSTRNKVNENQQQHTNHESIDRTFTEARLCIMSVAALV